MKSSKVRGRRVGSQLAAIAMAAAAGLASASATASPARPTVTLALAHWVPPVHPINASIKAWAESLKAESGGTIGYRIYPAEQLGKAVDHYDMARDGIADFTLVNPGYQPGRFPIAAAGELPFLFGDAKRGTAAFDAWYRPYAAREMPGVHYCLGVIQDPGTFHSKRPITIPADVKGLKVRPADATIGAYVRLMGGTNVQASAPAARDLMEHGVADAVTSPWGSVVLFGIDRIARWHLDVRMYSSIQLWVMNKARYDGLSPLQRKAIDDHCTTDWAVRFASPWADFEHAGRARIAAEPGHVLTKPTDAQLALWRQAAAPLKARWAALVRARGDGDPDAIFAALEASIAKYGAGY